MLKLSLTDVNGKLTYLGKISMTGIGICLFLICIFVASSTWVILAYTFKGFIQGVGEVMKGIVSLWQ